MKNTNKMTYEEPKLQIITFCAQDVLANSFDPFLGEDDMLGNEQANGYNLTWQEK